MGRSVIMSPRPPGAISTPGEDPLDGLEGRWSETTADGTVITEEWVRTHARLLLGTGTVMKKGTVRTEQLAIEARGDERIYVAHPQGQARLELRQAPGAPGSLTSTTLSRLSSIARLSANRYGRRRPARDPRGGDARGSASNPLPLARPSSRRLFPTAEYHQSSPGAGPAGGGLRRAPAEARAAGWLRWSRVSGLLLLGAFPLPCPPSGPRTRSSPSNSSPLPMAP